MEDNAVIDIWRRDRILAGAHLRAIRLASGYNQLELEARSGVAHEIISRLELGRQAPSQSTLRRLATALERSPADLAPPGPEAAPLPAHLLARPGRLTVSDDHTVCCHICGGSYGNLGGHVRQSHGLDAAAYKELAGLKQGTGLVAPALRQRHVEQSKRRVGSAGFTSFQQAARRSQREITSEERSVRQTGRRARLEERESPRRLQAQRDNLAKANARLAELKATGQFQPTGFQPEEARDASAKAHERLALLRQDPEWRSAFAAKVSAARGGRLVQHCSVCGKEFTDPSGHRRITCGDRRCLNRRRQQQLVERKAERVRAGRVLRDARRQAGLSQTALAEVAGVSSALISRTESGNVGVGPALTRWLASQSRRVSSRPRQSAETKRAA